MKKILAIFLAFSFMPSIAIAGRYHTPDLESWTLELNHGVAYINSPQMPSHCTYSRAQISMSGTEFDKAQFAMVLAAFKSKTKIRVIVDRNHTTCVMSGLIDYN